MSKLQANIKGWLFRKRRARLLSKLEKNFKKKDSEAEIPFEDDFDAEQFFGIKEENLNQRALEIDDDLMLKAIEIMAGGIRG